MPTRSVVLRGHQAELIERLVSSGRYQNASEVRREEAHRINLYLTVRAISRLR
jgi:Arc/MetJ-type ribon-helix-helix transcriptional regulator